MLRYNNVAWTFIYDNDGDSRSPSTVSTGGTNVYLYDIPTNIAQLVDSILDDNSLSTGKFIVFPEGAYKRYIYTISYNGSLLIITPPTNTAE